MIDTDEIAHELTAPGGAAIAQIRERFLSLHETAASGDLEAWLDVPGDCLALVIVLDQFPRNIYRGEPAGIVVHGAKVLSEPSRQRPGLAEGMAQDPSAKLH